MTEPTITLDRDAGLMFIHSFGIEPICHFCKGKITKMNFGGIFGKDKEEKVFCDALPCIMELSNLIK